jgi:hypothetical protein
MSDIKAYDKDQQKQFKKTLPEGVVLEDWVAINRDASRLNAILRNPDYEKYTDEQGMLKPEYQETATNFEPYYLYYKPAFTGKPTVTPEDVLKFHQGQTGGLTEYRDLINRGYMPKKKNGGSVNQADAKPIEKLDQLLNFTNYNKPTKGGWLDRYK